MDRLEIGGEQRLAGEHGLVAGGAVPARRGVRRGYAVIPVIGILIAAAFGRIWLSTAAAGLSGGRAINEIAGWALYRMARGRGLGLRPQGYPASTLAERVR